MMSAPRPPLPTLTTPSFNDDVTADNFSTSLVRHLATLQNSVILEYQRATDERECRLNSTINSQYHELCRLQQLLNNNGEATTAVERSSAFSSATGLDARKLPLFHADEPHPTLVCIKDDIQLRPTTLPSPPATLFCTKEENQPATPPAEHIPRLHIAAGTSAALEAGQVLPIIRHQSKSSIGLSGYTQSTSEFASREQGVAKSETVERHAIRNLRKGITGVSKSSFLHGFRKSASSLQASGGLQRLRASASSLQASYDRSEFDHQPFQLWPEWLHEIDLMISGDVKKPPARQQFVKTFSLATGEVRSSCVIEPNSSLTHTWEGLGIPLLAYDLLTIPMDVFDRPENALLEQWFGPIILAYWFLDMVRMFFQGQVLSDGRKIMTHSTVVRRYLCHTFAFDLFVVCIDALFLLGTSSERLNFFGAVRIGKLFRILRLLRFARLMRVQKFTKMYQVVQDNVDSNYFSIVLQVCKSLIIIMSINHIVACSWWWVGKVGNNENTWIDEFGFIGDTWQYKYWTSLHWSICQFSPGASQANAQNTQERMFTVGVLLMGLVVFSSFVSSITVAFKSLQNEASEQKQQSWLLRRYLRQNGISKDLTLRINRYVNVVFRARETRVSHNDVKLLTALSDPLHFELQTELHFPTLAKHPLLEYLGTFGRFMTGIKKVCCEAVKLSELSEGDVLFSPSQVAHHMYFVTHGTLQYVQHDRDPVDVDVGQNFCEAVLWTAWSHFGLMCATSYTSLMVLHAAQFRSVASEYPTDMRILQKYALAFVDCLNDAAEFSASSRHANPEDDAKSEGSGAWWSLSDLQMELLSDPRLLELCLAMGGESQSVRTIKLPSKK